MPPPCSPNLPELMHSAKHVFHLLLSLSQNSRCRSLLFLAEVHHFSQLFDAVFSVVVVVVVIVTPSKMHHSKICKSRL